MITLKTSIPLIISFCFIPLLVFASSKTELIVGYGRHNAPPYAIEKAEQLSGGIIKDIVTVISAELNIKATFIKAPRKRVERYLENNTIHLWLITNPAWLSNSEKLQWSETLFIERDKIVIKADNPTIYQALPDFIGMNIGTIRGYKYPNLQPFFDKEYFVRYDVSNLEVNFIRLALNRIDAFVDADILINYHLKQSKNPQVYKVLPMTISQHNIQAALSPNAPITLKQFNQALNKLKARGVIAKILQKYQLERQ